MRSSSPSRSATIGDVACPDAEAERAARAARSGDRDRLTDMAGEGGKLAPAGAEARQECPKVAVQGAMEDAALRRRQLDSVTAHQEGEDGRRGEVVVAGGRRRQQVEFGAAREGARDALCEGCKSARGGCAPAPRTTRSSPRARRSSAATVRYSRPRRAILAPRARCAASRWPRNSRRGPAGGLMHRPLPRASGGISSAPLKGGPPKNFEPVISTIRPRPRWRCSRARPSRAWQASTTIRIASPNRASIVSRQSIARRAVAELRMIHRMEHDALAGRDGGPGCGDDVAVDLARIAQRARRIAQLHRGERHAVGEAGDRSARNHLAALRGGAR